MKTKTLSFLSTLILFLAAGSLASPAGAQQSRTLEEEERAIDQRNLLEIYQAIQAYKKDHGDLPNWLSDLFPDYLSEPGVLISPVETRTGRSQLFSYADPKMHSSYIYEFNGHPAPAHVNRDREIPLTMREWKTRQMEAFGPATPILRCHLHNPTINVAFSGDVYETETQWEFDPRTVELLEKLGPWPENPDQRWLRITIQDQSGTPLVHSEARLEMSSDVGNHPARRFDSDEQGVVRLPLGSGTIQMARVLLSADDHVVKVQAWEGDQAQSIPESMEVRLDPAQVISGKVVDTENRPVAGARIVISGAVRDEAGQFIPVEYETLNTNAEGRWKSTRVPVEEESLAFELSHPEFMPSEFFQVSDGEDEQTVTTEELTSGAAVFVVQPGISLEGVVRGSDERPLADALILVGQRGGDASMRRGRTDDGGRFRLVFFEEAETWLTVQAEGQAPHLEAITLEPGLKPLAITLQPGRTVKGRVAGRNEEPVEGAQVSVHSWRDVQSLEWSTATDADGYFTWESAPEDAVICSISAQGYNPAQHRLQPGEAEIKVLLQQTLMVKGKVVDAETGAPIPTFQITPGMSWGPGQVHWERHAQRSGSQGEYSFTQERRRGGEIKLMVSAPGYLPGASPSFPDFGWHTHDFELKKGEGPRGMAQLPDGQPAVGAEVAILSGSGYVALGKGQFEHSDPGTLVKTDEAGKFSLPAPPEPALIVVVHEGGYAEINSDELKEETPLRLQAWGELKGVMMIGREPGTGKSIQLMRQRMHGPGSLNFGSHFRVDTDEQGRFSFSHVPPGPIQLARLIPMGPRSWTFSHAQSVVIPPGETIEVVYGGTGRPVTGRLALSDPGREVDWRHGHNSLSTKMPQPPQGSSREEIMAWQQSEEFRDAIANRRSYGIVIDEEGTFRVDDVPAGEYSLSFNLMEPADDRPGMGTPIGSLSREVTVPEMAEARSDEPLDLGELIIQVRNTLRIGDKAPDFEVETLSGGKIKLSDFRGKVVLLDFWATWCGPCIAELPHLKAVYEEFGQDERFAMIALSLDAEKKEPQEFVKKNQLKWIQGFLGEWPKTNVPAQFGVQGIPATFVIGPDGTIQAMNLRGTAIRAGVERVLRSSETVAAP